MELCFTIALKRGTDQSAKVDFPLAIASEVSGSRENFFRVPDKIISSKRSASPAGKSERDGLRIGNSSLQICILRSGIILSELADISRVFTLADTLFRDLRLIKRFLSHRRYSAGATASAGGASMSVAGWIGIATSAAGTYSTCSSLFSASALRISVPSSTRTNAPTVVRSPVVKG